ncbi:hypothetical protein Tco_1554341 [Tanacetum coccineum]
MEASPSTVDGNHRATHRTTRIDLWYPGRMYVSGHVDIFDMVDIDLFTIVALNIMVLKLDSYLKAPRFRATLEDITDEPAGSIATNKTEKMMLLTWHESSETTKEPVCYSVTPSSLPQHDSSTTCKDSVCESITPRCMPDCILTPPTDESTITYTQLSGVHGIDTQIHVIDDVIRQLLFDETEFNGEAGFADVVRSGLDSSGLCHDESFGVDDLDLNLNEPVNLNVSHVETQSELPVSEEPDVGPTQEPILAKISTQEPIVAEVSTQGPIVAEVSTEAPIVEEVGTHEFNVEDVVIEEYVSSGEDVEDAEQGNGQEDESAHTDREFFYDDEGIYYGYETEYDVQSSEDAGTDDDVDADFLVDEENEIVEPDVDVHLFGISMDLPFDNIGITNLVPDDVLEGEDVDVINADGFDSDPDNDKERNYKKRRLAELSTEMEEAKDRVNLHSIESRRNLKLYKNDSIRIKARCEVKVHVFTMSQGTRPTGPNSGMEAGPSGSSGPTTRSKKKKNTCTNDDSQASPSFLDANYKGDLCPWVLYVGKDKFTQNWVVKTHKDIHTCLQSMEIKHCTYKFLSEKIFKQVRVNPNIPVKAVQDQLQRELEVQISMSKAFRSKAKAEREIREDHCLGDDIDLHPNSNFTFISDRQKGIISAIKTVYLIASAINVRNFEKCMLELKTMNPKAHEWLNKIPAECRAKSDLLLNNICKVINGKIVKGRDKPVITLLEYIREYCMKRIVNVQGVIDKCTSPLTPTATRIMESIKKEAHLMKVQWNGANKYQVSCSLGDQCVVDVVGRPKKKRKRSKHEDEPFVKDGNLSRKGRTITCQSCGNTGHNKATCKGQGGNNAEAGGEGAGGGPGGAGVARQGFSRTRWTKRRVQTQRISPQKITLTQPSSQPSTSSQVLVSQTRNADGR